MKQLLLHNIFLLHAQVLVSALPALLSPCLVAGLALLADPYADNQMKISYRKLSHSITFIFRMARLFNLHPHTFSCPSSFNGRASDL